MSVATKPKLFVIKAPAVRCECCLRFKPVVVVETTISDETVDVALCFSCLREAMGTLREAGVA